MRYTSLTLLALLTLTTAASALDLPVKDREWIGNPKTQPMCQNVSVYDRLFSKMMNRKNPADQAEAGPLFAAYNTPEAEARKALCLTVRKGDQVKVESLYGGYQCAKLKSHPNHDCFWGNGLSTAKTWSNITTPGKDLEWLY